MKDADKLRQFLDENLPPARVTEEEAYDLACDFIEQEVGRHDWKNNWRDIRHEAEQRVSAWFNRIGLPGVDPTPVISKIDHMTTVLDGVWT